MVSCANCSKTEDAAVSDCRSLFLNHIFSLPYINKVFRRGLPVGRNYTVYKSPYDLRSTHNNHLRKLIQKPLQQTNEMDKHDGSQFVHIHLPAVERLAAIMTTRGKVMQYNMLSTAGLMPSMMYTYNAKCGDSVAYGCGSSMNEAIEDAATKFLEKFESISTQDDENFVNLMNSLSLESEVGVESNNYIGKLQEYCQSHSLDIPKYEYYQESDIKNKRYMYSVICSTGQYECMGVGLSKQIAKNHAAYSLYNAIINSMSNARNKKIIDFGPDLSRNEAKNEAVNIALDEIYYGRNKIKMTANYIGLLQENCVVRGWELPKYEFHQKICNETNTLYYSVICFAGPYKSTGVGNSKQLAKNKAAESLCGQINLDQEKTSVLHTNCASDIVEKCKSKIIQLENCNPCDYLFPVELWRHQLSSSNKECVQKLSRCIAWTEINTSPFKFLTKLANEEDFSVKYERICDNVNGKQAYGAIHVQVATKHVTTFIGVGNTDTEAQNSVAKNTLTFIKHIILNI